MLVVPSERKVQMTRAVFLPEHLSARIARLPEHRLGIHRVTAKLRDGRICFPVLVAWETEIVRSEGSSQIPYTAADVVDLYHDNGARASSAT